MAPSINAPLLNWPGSKRRDAKQIVDAFPVFAEVYIEPFLGSASILLEVLRRAREGKNAFSRFLVTDKNDRLIAFYQAVQSFPEQVFQEAERIFDSFWNQFDPFVFAENGRSPKLYILRKKLTLSQGGKKLTRNVSAGRTFFAENLRALNEIPSQDTSPKTAARFLFCNRAAFGGMVRVQEKIQGKQILKASFGGKGLRYSSVNVFQEQMFAFSSLIQPVEFLFGGVENIFSQIPERKERMRGLKKREIKKVSNIKEKNVSSSQNFIKEKNVSSSQNFIKNKIFLYADPPYVTIHAPVPAMYQQGGDFKFTPISLAQMAAKWIQWVGGSIAISYPDTQAFRTALKQNVSQGVSILFLRIGSSRGRKYGLRPKQKGVAISTSRPELLAIISTFE